MKFLVSLLAVFVMSVPAVAAPGSDSSRRSMSAQMMAAPRLTTGTYMASKHVTAVDTGNNSGNNNGNNNGGNVTPTPDPEPEKPVNNREKEKQACLSGNIGVGNTFVWASRYSNVDSYATMVEDIDNPENNTCFALVELKSDDSKINVSDLPKKYFEVGQNITCGSWVNASDVEKRILDGKKAGRTWGTVAGVVGGAGVGVGAMELFGNEMIGGKVQGQQNKNLTSSQVLISQLKVLQKEDKKIFDEYIRTVKALLDECKEHATDIPDCQDDTLKIYKEVQDKFKDVQK